MKTTERQENEIGPKTWSTKGATGYCVICRQRILLGEQYYAMINSTSRRHKDCAKEVRKYVDPAAPTKPTASSTGVRRRSAGHGYSGGDGMTEHFT